MKKAEREHLDRVAQLGCVVCYNLVGRWCEASIHHLRAGRGMGQRSTHFRSLPLCPMHHQNGGFGIAFHAGRNTWQAEFGNEEKLLEQVQQALVDGGYR